MPGPHKCPVIARRDEMEGAAHQRRLHHRAVAQGGFEIVMLEVRELCMKGDVRRWRVLRLKGGKLLYRLGDWQPRAR